MAQNVTFKLTVDNKGIVTGSRQATKEVKAVDRATASAKKQTGALSRAWKRFGGVVTGLAIGAVVQRGFRRAIRVGREFETQLADLEAITGITGDSLEFLGDAALETSNRYGVASREIVEAQKLVASQLAQKIDFGTDEGIRQLREVADQAVLLQQAAGVDLNTAVQATTTALNQFNLAASETNRVINTIAAGAKLGAAEARDQAEAYRDSGTAFATAGQSLESLNASVQILAANAIRGSRAGTGLRNIITRLETRADKLAENGFENLNLQADGFAVTMQKLTPLLDDVTARSEIFGEEAQGLAAILIENSDALIEMEGAVTGTDIAMEQAEVKMGTFDAAVNRLVSTFDNKLIESFQETNGIGVKFINMVTDAIGAVGEAIDNINHWQTSHKDLRRELELTETQVRSTIQVSRDTIADIENEIEARNLQGEALAEARQAIKDLQDRYKEILPDFEAYEKSLKRQIQEEKDRIVELRESRSILFDNSRAMFEASQKVERLTLRLQSAQNVQAIYREEVADTTTEQDSQTESVDETTEAVKSLKEQLSSKKDQIDELLNQDAELKEADMERLIRLEQERRELEKTADTRERLLQLQVDALEQGIQQKSVKAVAIEQEESLAETIARRNIEEGRTGEIVVDTGRRATSAYTEEATALDQVAEAALRAAASAAVRAENAGDVANAVIDAIFAEIVAIAIKKAMESIPFPFNILAAGAAAGAASGLRGLIPEFAEGGMPTGAIGQSGMTTPGQKLISINERRKPEYIINDQSTDAALPLLDRINSSPTAARAISRQVMGFAGGGRVTGADVPGGRGGMNTDAIAEAVRQGLAGSVVVANVNIEELKRGLERFDDFENSIGN